MSWRRKLVVALATSLSAVLVAASLSAPAPAVATALPNSRGGMVVQWYFGTPAEYTTAANQVQASGVGWVRIDLRWSTVQSGGSGSWNWSDTDKQVTAALGKGLKVLLLPSYSPAWANGGHTDERYYPADINAWKAFLTAAAQRYIPQGVTAWELWNEPNWSPQSNPALYASNILKPGSDALRAASVSLQTPITIVDAAPASLLNTPGIVDPYAWVTQVYANGGKPYFDVQAIHPYTWPSDPTVPSTFNHLLRAIEIHNTMAANGDGGKQVWATEFGFPTRGPNTNTEAQQADYINKGLQVWTQSAWLSWTGPMFLYTHKNDGDNPNDPEKNFGLVRTDFTPKPAMTQLPGFLAAIPAAPAPPTSGYGGGGGTPPAGGNLINGLENVNQWSGEATRTAVTAQKTEGTQSIRATFAVPSNGWSNFDLVIASPYANLSGATSLQVDIYPLSQTPSGQNEPITIKLHDHAGGVIYEQPVARLIANQWTTVTVNLASIPAANRASLDDVDLYLWSGYTGGIGGRTSVAYNIDNLRFTTPGVPSSGLVNGLENVSQWNGEAARLAITAQKTEGAQSIRATYTVPANGWSNFNLPIASPYVNLSTATSIKVDIFPLSSTPAGQNEPIALKLQDATGGTIYEQAIGHLNPNQWNTVTISLTGIPAANRTKLSAVTLYLWSGWTAQLGGRTSVAYYVDNLRYQ